MPWPFFTCDATVYEGLYCRIEREKRKESKSIYIVPFILPIVSKCSDMDHTVLPANTRIWYSARCRIVNDNAESSM